MVVVNDSHRITADQTAYYQRKITDAAEGLLDTMESMLLWSKRLMQQFKPNVKVIAVETLFEYLQQFFLGVTQVRFRFDAPDGLQVTTDEDYLRTIMQNLTSNAIKALTNQPDALIHWQAQLEEGQVILLIRDNGPGMSEGQFQALYTSDSAISSKSGLGLHLIRDLARPIDCHITVRSEQGIGTEFRLAFV